MLFELTEGTTQQAKSVAERRGLQQSWTKPLHGADSVEFLILFVKSEGWEG